MLEGPKGPKGSKGPNGPKLAAKPARKMRQVPSSLPYRDRTLEVPCVCSLHNSTFNFLYPLS